MMIQCNRFFRLLLAPALVLAFGYQAVAFERTDVLDAFDGDDPFDGALRFEYLLRLRLGSHW